jgi:hypothetical protein
MAPIRRYLRITKYSVLEVRIYLHKPSDAAWLLSSRDNVLERVIQVVRPKVLPKLREENENARKKSGKKKKGIKDVASQEDFEVAIFLKETATRHSLLTKQKGFTDKPRLQSNSGKLTGWLGKTKEDAINIEEEERAPVIMREDEDHVELSEIPEAGVGDKRKPESALESNIEEQDDRDDEAMFVSSSDEDFFATQRAKPAKRQKRTNRGNPPPNEPPPPTMLNPEEEEEDIMEDDKKKLALDTTYDGFSIYGRILCLIVTRKGKRAEQHQHAPVGGSQMMEQWIGTQAAQEAGLDGYDEG